MKKTKYIYPFIILLSSVIAISCEDDDVNDTVPFFEPELGFRAESIIEEVNEGDTAFFDVAIFSDRTNLENVNVSWSTTGAETSSGTVTIPAGEKVASFFIANRDNRILDGERSITLTLSTDSGIPLIEGSRSSFTYDIIEDLKVFSIGGTSIDTLEVSESDGVLLIPLNVTSDIDEDVTIDIEADAESTATGGDDYIFPDGVTFTIDSGTASPAIRVELVNNNTLNTSDRFLKVNLIGASGSPEVSLGDVANSIVYKIVDDIKTFQIQRLDLEVPVNEDTLRITSAGTHSFTTSLLGANVVGVTALNVDADLDPGLAGLFSFDLINDGGVVLYESGDRFKDVVFNIEPAAFELAGSNHIRFSLTGFNSNAGDNDEIRLDDDEISLVVEIVGRQP